MGKITKAYIVPHPPIIVPQVGKGSEVPATATIIAYEAIAREIEALKPDVIIVTTPHGTVYSDAVHISSEPVLKGDFKDFGANEPTFEFENDLTLRNIIQAYAEKENLVVTNRVKRGNALDHGVLVPLYFITRHYKDFKLIRVAISGLSPHEHYLFGSCIAKAIEQTELNAVFVASGDLSHRLTEEGPYGFHPKGPEFDRQLISSIENADFESLINMDQDFCEQAGECGHRSFLMLAGALNGLDVTPQILSYEGPFGVGYLVASFEPKGPNPDRNFLSQQVSDKKHPVLLKNENENPFVALARLTLETYIQTGKRITLPAGLPAELTEKRAGAFVSLKKNGSLRGCIGTIAPTCKSLAEEIIQNAISSGTQDPRFPAVRTNELEELVYSVDVLGEPEPVAGLEALDVKRYGVIVSSGFKRGLLLPDLEGVDTPEDQVAIAMNKAGIGKHEAYTLERFEVIRHQ